MNRRQLAFALLAAAVALPLALSAQVKGTATDIALYQGADRLQKLIAGAKKEGTFTIYTSAQANDFNALLSAFEKKYGVKGVIWRAGSENVLNRAVRENRANRHTVDIV